MKKLVIILFLGLLSCKTEKNISSKKCYESEQRDVLENSVRLFELKLKKQYPELSNEAAYFEFISDWSDKKLSVDFFKDSLELKIRNLNLWTESNRSGKDMELEKRLFNVDSMNPIRIKLNEQFSKCIAFSTKVEGIRNFLIVNTKYRYSPKLAKKSLLHTSEYDLKEFDNRLVIVLGVYYQTMFNIKVL
ncbi:hypothetical protein [Gaetbulibacter jejuensis]|uniref:Lipoprotein n=1 Tax=Gaetbulibacter jejuensis TaxID=584607 RepID=A0ABP3V0X6_9FLAO